MGILHRLGILGEEKASAAIDRAEDPAEALDLAVTKQAEALQEARRHVATVLTAEKNMEIQRNTIEQQQTQLRAQAQQALTQGREDLARQALTRAQSLQGQLDTLEQQIVHLKEEDQKLETAVAGANDRLETLRFQKDSLKATIAAEGAVGSVDEGLLGISTKMQDADDLMARAQEKANGVTAHSAALDDLLSRGAFDTNQSIEAQLSKNSNDQAVEAQLAEMKMAKKA